MHIHARIYRNKFSLINSAAASKFNFKIPFPRRHFISCHFLTLEFQKNSCSNQIGHDFHHRAPIYPFVPSIRLKKENSPRSTVGKLIAQLAEIKMEDCYVKGVEIRWYEYARKALTGWCPRPSHHVTVVADSGVVTVPTISNVFHGRSDVLCSSIPGLSHPLTEDPLIVRPCIVMIPSSAPSFSPFRVYQSPCCWNYNDIIKLFRHRGWFEDD